MSATTPERPAGGEGDGSTEAALSPLVVLTTAELLIVESIHADELDRESGIGVEGPAVTTTAADSSGTHRPAAASAARQAELDEARRSLVGRGLITREGRLGDGGPGDLARLLLDVRLGAESLIVVERVVLREQPRPEMRLLHLIADGGVVEDVHPDGLVGMVVATDPAELLAAVLQAFLPMDAVAGSGTPRVLDASHPEQLADQLAEALVLVELSRARPQTGEVEAWVLAVGTDGCYLGARPAPGSTDTALVLRPTDPDQVRSMVRGWVGEVVRGDC